MCKEQVQFAPGFSELTFLINAAVERDGLIKSKSGFSAARTAA